MYLFPFRFASTVTISIFQCYLIWSAFIFIRFSYIYFDVCFLFRLVETLFSSSFVIILTQLFLPVLSFCVLHHTGPVSGWLTNKIGTAAVSFSGSVIAGLACCAAAYTNSIYVMIVLFGLVAGIGTGFMFMAAVAAVSRWFDTRRALATGMAVSGAGVGIFVFAPFLRLLIEHYGGEGAMLIEGGLAFQGCVFALLLRPLPARKSCKIQPNFLRDKNGILQIVEEETVPLEKSPIDSDQTIQFSTKVDGRFITMKDVLGSWIFGCLPGVNCWRFFRRWVRWFFCTTVRCWITRSHQCRLRIFCPCWAWRTRVVVWCLAHWPTISAEQFVPVEWDHYGVRRGHGD